MLWFSVLSPFWNRGTMLMFISNQFLWSLFLWLVIKLYTTQEKLYPCNLSIDECKSDKNNDDQMFTFSKSSGAMTSNQMTNCSVHKLKNKKTLRCACIIPRMWLKKSFSWITLFRFFKNWVCSGGEIDTGMGR